VLLSDPLGNTTTLQIMVGPGISIKPTKTAADGHFTATSTPGQEQKFTATGGLGRGFKWTLAPNNSKGTLSATGTYKAGADITDVADTITVTDTLGNSAKLIVAVSGAVAKTAAAPGKTGDTGGCGCRGATDLTPGALLVALAFAARRRRLARL
jgi:hypothetical protein